MGCCSSKAESQESVSRCKGRRRYMKELVKARRAFACSHCLYLHSLRSAGSALLQFSNAESCCHQTPNPNPNPNPNRNLNRKQIPQPPPPPPPPLSPAWTNSSSITASPILPPPPPPTSAWDFWDPFAPSSSHSVAEEEWDDIATNASEAGPQVTVTLPSSPAPPIKENGNGNGGGGDAELAVVVASRNGKKDLGEVVKELDEYFLKAAEAGALVSVLLEAPSCLGSDSSSGVLGKMRSLNPFNSKGSDGFTRFESSTKQGSHSSTVEKLYAWEKKLFLEVKNSEKLRGEHEKRVNLLRKQELKGADYVKIEKNKREIESLESKIMVASQAMETTSSEITRLRESELFPQLLQLLNDLTGMWRSMYECHQVQTHIVQQLTYLATSPPSSAPTSNAHRQATLQLELEVDRWHSSFCNLVRSHREYVHSLTGWLRLSLFNNQHHHNTPMLSKISNIYSTCEEWYLALDRIPDRVASEGIKSFLNVVHAIVLQQGEELKQKKKSESAFKDAVKRANELRSLEAKNGNTTPVVLEKKVKVDVLKAKAEEEKVKYEKSSSMTRAMTVNNLQTGFPNVFQAVTGFSSVCMQAFEEVGNHHQRSLSQMNVKLLT